MLSLLYGVAAYLSFAAVAAYTALFTAGLVVPKTIDSGASASIAHAAAVDVALLLVFALQHSIMARRSFKRWLTRWIPAAIERSTYVLASTSALALLVWQWEPIAEPMIWHVEDTLAAGILRAGFCLGWIVIFVSTFLLGHFEFLGLAQVVAKMRGRELPESEFRTPLFYRYVRHPIYFGFLLTFFSVPAMSASHLLFSLGATGYILVGVWFEERDLIAQFGERYSAYRQQVGMLLPWRKAP